MLSYFSWLLISCSSSSTFISVNRIFLVVLKSLCDSSIFKVLWTYYYFQFFFSDGYYSWCLISLCAWLFLCQSWYLKITSEIIWGFGFHILLQREFCLALRNSTSSSSQLIFTVFLWAWCYDDPSPGGFEKRGSMSLSCLPGIGHQ